MSAFAVSLLQVQRWCTRGRFHSGFFWGQPRHSIICLRGFFLGVFRGNNQFLPVKVADGLRKPYAAAMLQLVVHKVHWPYLVHGIRQGKDFLIITHQALSRLGALVEFQLTTNAMHLSRGIWRCADTKNRLKSPLRCDWVKPSKGSAISVFSFENFCS